MSDVWSTALHQASYGGVEFDCLATRDSIARALIRSELPRRNGGPVQDMGADQRTTRCQLLFWERPPLKGETAQGNHLQRFAAFWEATQRGKAQAFVHPITGPYQARVEDLDFDADAAERDAISVSCTFVESAPEPARFDPGALLDPYSGAAAMRTSAELARADLAAAGIDPSVAGDASSMVDSWESDPSKSVREVSLELASLNSRIDRMIDDYELATDLSKFGPWRRLQELSYTAKRAAALFKRSQPQVIQITVAAPVPLRVLAADTYGASEASARYADMMRMNDIDDPLLLETGTVLRAPAPSARKRAA